MTDIVIDGGRMRAARKEAVAVKPDEVNANSHREMYYWRYLWRLLAGRFEILCPKYWTVDYVRDSLLLAGSFAVTQWRGSIVPYIYNVVERSPWREPLVITSGDGLIKIGKREVGNDAEIVYLQSAYRDTMISYPPVADMLDIYAQRLALCDGSIDINLINTRTPWICEVDDKKDSFTLKALMTKIYNGEPAVFWRRKQSITGKNDMPITTLPVKQNYIAGDVHQLKQDIINEFLSQIGLPVTSNKRERLIMNEVVSNNAEGETAIELWKDNLELCCKKVNDMFGDNLLSIKIKNSALNTIREENEDGSNID